MAERHADELTLLAYVDGELTRGDRGALEQHLHSCSACADEARRLEAGRDALRAAPLLELPEERRRTILASLPAREERRGFFAPLRRLGPALPAAAALVLVAALVALATQLPRGGGDGDMGAAAEGQVQEDAAQEGAGDEGAAEEGAAEPEGDTRTAAPSSGQAKALAGADFVARVQGPAVEVVRLLRRSGHTAFVRDGSVLAVGDPDEIRTALASRRTGGVAVYAR